MNFHPRRKQDDNTAALRRTGSTGRWFALVDPERQREVPSEIEVRRTPAQTAATSAAPPTARGSARHVAD